MRFVTAAVLLALPAAGAVVSERSRADSAPSSLQSPIAKGEGIVTVPSHHTVDETVQRLQTLLGAKGVPIFALIDHSGGAAKAGLQMRPTKLLIFGNPKAGTPAMAAAPSLALDLPLKILIWQDASGKVWLSYNSIEYLRERYGVPANLMQNLNVVETLAAAAGQ